MADNDLDGDQTQGTPATPKAGSSQGNGDSNSSFDAPKLQTALEALTRRLDEVDQRSKALQGEKDRGINSTKKEVDELRRKFAEIEKLKKSGLDDEGAFEELTFRDEVRNLRQEISKLSPAQTQTPGKGEGAAVDVAKVISDYQLDGNDPEVIAEVLSKKFASPLEAENAALKLAYRRANPTPPTLGAAATLQGKPAAPSENEDAIYAQIAELSKNRSLNRDKIAALKKRLGT